MFLQRLLFERYLDKGEILLFTIHRHWITIKSQMLKIFFLGYATPVAFMLLVTGHTGPASYPFYAWIGIAFLYSIYAWMDWYLDAWLLTDTCVIDTAWDGFLKQRSSRIDYQSIESVDIEVKGLKQTVLNYGTMVLIKSSGNDVMMEAVHNPQKASNWLTKIQSEVIAAKNSQDSESIKDLLADIIQEHIRVNS